MCVCVCVCVCVRERERERERERIKTTQHACVISHSEGSFSHSTSNRSEKSSPQLCLTYIMTKRAATSGKKKKEEEEEKKKEKKDGLCSAET